MTNTVQQVSQHFEKLTLAAITATYNEFADTPVKKFRDKATAVSRTTKLITDSGMTVSRGTIVPVSETVAKPRTQLTDDIQVSVNAESNPKRGASKLRFALYGKCETIGEYLDACVKLEKGAKPRFKYLSDIHWDLKRGYITLDGDFNK